MSLLALGKPSTAREFYLRITHDPDPAAAIKQLAHATPPQFETEWLDFKGAAQIRDGDTKRLWSEALAGFANTQGGILVWGIDARPDPATGVDAACGLSLVPNPSAFKSRLNQLLAQATEPPVLGVEIEAYSIGDPPGGGFVVCYIPESPFRPHRAESPNRQYVIRAADHFVTASVSLLRNLFFPQVRCLLVPTLKARRVVNSGITEFHIDGFLKNIGSATAFDTFVITHSSPNGASFSIEGWQTGSLVPCNSRAKMPIHPGVSTHFFATGYPPKTQATFKIQIFAQDAEPAEWLASFTEAEMEGGAEKKGERRLLHLPTE